MLFKTQINAFEGTLVINKYFCLSGLAPCGRVFIREKKILSSKMFNYILVHL